MTTQTADQPTVESLPGQTSLLDLSGREVYADFYDDKAPIFVPNNVLHYKTHKLEVMVKRLERQSIENPAQFTAKTYKMAVDDLMECYKQIKEEAERNATNNATDDIRSEPVLDEGEVAERVSESGGQEALRERASNGLDSGVSADNPFARPRLHPA